MPRGPRGEKRPADVIGAAVMVARIAILLTPVMQVPSPLSCRSVPPRQISATVPQARYLTGPISTKGAYPG
jgi:hypothetical protein